MVQTTLRDYLQTTEDAISSGRISDALANCQHILTHFPEVLEAQRLLGEVYLAQGQLEEAQQTFDWVLTNDPENVIAYCSRALISERMSDYNTALDCYQQAYELSRGNSQIRQEFNQLSEKVGQQGFIFSRAGLARLYMRGDLLPQAIQEWESVLASSPERLDARIGLLKKAPGAFPETAATGENTSTGTNATTTTSPFSDPLMRWSSLDNIVEPHQDYQVVQEVSPLLGTWPSNGTPEPDRWNPISQVA